MTDIVSRILSYQITADTPVSALLAYFLPQNPPVPPDILPFIQHQVIHQLRKILRADSSLTSIRQLISNSKLFHCSSAYHEVVMKTVLKVYPDFTCSTQISELPEEILVEFFAEGSILLRSFTEDLAICAEHCQCNSIRCHLKLNKLLQETCLSSNYYINLNSALIFEHFFNQILSDSSRCRIYEFLKLTIEVLKQHSNPELTKYLHNLITSSALLDALQPYFPIGRCFTGSRNAEFVPKDDNSLEYTNDCVLIRSYILLFQRLLQVTEASEESKQQFVQQLYRIQSVTEKNSKTPTGSKSSDLPTWLVTVFLTEDSELFEMLYLSVMLATTPPQVQFIDCLFGAFLSAIYNDASTLLEMLTTDSSTATTALEFFLAYLKLPRDQQDETIKSVLQDLKLKITRLHSKGIFPYNPSALIRLLD